MRNSFLVLLFLLVIWLCIGSVVREVLRDDFVEKFLKKRHAKRKI